MRTVREHAFRLRLAGKSYNEIHKELGIPKSTLSGWLRHVVLNERAKARLDIRTHYGGTMLIKHNKMQTHLAEQRARRAQAEGRSRITKLSKSDLLLTGVILYWAEGYKRLKVRDGKQRMGHTISFVNSDAEMVGVFVSFLREILSIPANLIRLNMRLYKHINEKEARAYWTRATGITDARFFKTTYLVSGASKGRRPFNRLPWGTLQVEVCNTGKFHYLMGMIEGVKEMLAHGTVRSSLGSSVS